MPSPYGNARVRAQGIRGTAASGEEQFALGGACEGDGIDPSGGGGGGAASAGPGRCGAACRPASGRGHGEGQEAAAAAGESLPQAL